MLAGLVLLALLAGLTILAVRSAQADHHHLSELERISLTATALEQARAEFYLETTALAGLTVSRDPYLTTAYAQAKAGLDNSLSQARAGILATGEASDLATLDDVIQRRTQFEQTLDLALPQIQKMDQTQIAQAANTYLPQMWDLILPASTELDQLAASQSNELAAQRAAADSAAETTLWLLIGFSAAAFAVGAVTVATVLLSVVRPLARLRESARAITSGDLQARAKVFGPEEVASLARGFNEMTDTLSAKTEEYIATTNLTGDIVAKLDKHGMWAFLNDAACQFYGKPREELLGTDSRASVHPEDLEPTAQFIRDARAEKALTTGFVNRQVTPRGIRVVEWNGHALFDAAGKYAGIQITGRDMTERKQIQQALEESESRYRLLTENTADVVWTMDLDLKYTYISPAITRMRGYTPEEMMSLSAAETMTSASFELARKNLIEALAVERTGDADPNRETRAEYEMYCKDGSAIWTEMNMTFMRDQDGHAVGILGTTRDISKRKKAEQALEESETRYRLLADNSLDIIWTMDLSLRYTYVSPAVERVRGYTPEEVIGQNVAVTLTPPSLEFARKTLAAELAREETDDPERYRPRLLELEMYRKDGSTVWTEASVMFLRDADDHPIGLLGITRDISERKKAEQALEETERRYRLIADNSLDIIWTMDMSLKYTYMSPAVKRMRGYDPEEVVGQTVAETLTSASLQLARETMVEELAMEQDENKDLHRPRALELEMYCKDGSTIWTEVMTVFLRDADTRPIGILGITRDISERKKADEERARLYAELQTKAITDGLTTLYNRDHFFQRLAEEIERSKRYGHGFALVMMDVDAFKHYNDSRGHQAGDVALSLVADCIRRAIRRSDTAFRYGGDEFVAILPHTDPSKAQTIVNRINRRITTRLREMDDPAAAWLGLSAGIACFPDDARTGDELVKLADEALYNAKRLAWARGVTVQGRAVESPSWPLHETQSGMLSVAASSLAAALQDLGASDVVAEPDLRTIAAVGAAAEIKDPYIRGHQERISRWAATLAQEMGLPAEQVRNIRIAGLLHDLGKVGINDAILNKPGKLTEEEFAKIKEHPALGATMITAKAEALQRLVPIVRHHHERFDGNGYPDGLARENIPLEARILSVVDVFDAMTHERAYRRALPREEAIAELTRGAGTHFDPDVVSAFLAVEGRGLPEQATASPAGQGGQLAAIRPPRAK